VINLRLKKLIILQP